MPSVLDFNQTQNETPVFRRIPQKFRDHKNRVIKGNRWNQPQTIWNQVSRSSRCDPALPFYPQNQGNNNLLHCTSLVNLPGPFSSFSWNYGPSVATGPKNDHKVKWFVQSPSQHSHHRIVSLVNYTLTNQPILHYQHIRPCSFCVTFIEIRSYVPVWW